MENYSTSNGDFYDHGLRAEELPENGAGGESDEEKIARIKQSLGEFAGHFDAYPHPDSVESDKSRDLDGQ